jgi:hypothetical protein
MLNKKVRTLLEKYCTDMWLLEWTVCDNVVVGVKAAAGCRSKFCRLYYLCCIIVGCSATSCIADCWGLETWSMRYKVDIRLVISNKVNDKVNDLKLELELYV